MENLPHEINYNILEYVYGCRKHNQQIFNKESQGVFFKITKLNASRYGVVRGIIALLRMHYTMVF